MNIKETELYEKYKNRIQTDRQMYLQAKAHWDGIAKPLDGLGKLEELICKIASVQRTPKVEIQKKQVFVFCADNGIVAEGVTQSGQEVTMLVAESMAKGTSSVCRMGKAAGAEVIPVNVGIANDIQIDGLIDRCVRKGTRDFLKEPAMKAQEAYRAMETGMEMAHSAMLSGVQLLAAGEMGIGNTTTSTAIICALTGLDPAVAAGKGAGLSAQGIARKSQVIQEAIDRYQLTEADPFQVLCCVGGFDLAAMAGFYLGAAVYGIPVVLDGVISVAAALVANRMFPGIVDAMLPSHYSSEPAAKAAIEELGLDAIMHGNFCLGEGTGAVLLFPLLDMAMEVYGENTTFADISMEGYKRFV